jgi:lipoate-protein ligase A
MQCVISPYTDPYFNLASEEYLLKEKSEDFFLLYRNEPSIVVGKHQNTLAEINHAFVTEHGLVVARRISGGGTVFHDMGNLNFAFITSGKEGELVDYRTYTFPVISAIKTAGANIHLGKRNELLLGKYKVSGTASHVYKGRVLHHGTLLFSSEINNLLGALRVTEGVFQDRAVRSVRSEVTNIRDHLPEKMNVLEFQDLIFNHILTTMKGSEKYSYSDHDLKKIRGLKKSKFSTWEWNYGYSPKYEYNKSILFGDGAVYVHMNVDKGIIQEVDIEGDFLGVKGISGLEDALVGTIHDPDTMRLRLSGIQVSDYITGMDNEQFLSGMF